MTQGISIYELLTTGSVGSDTSFTLPAPSAPPVHWYSQKVLVQSAEPVPSYSEMSRLLPGLGNVCYLGSGWVYEGQRRSRLALGALFEP